MTTSLSISYLFKQLLSQPLTICKQIANQYLIDEKYTPKSSIEPSLSHISYFFM